MDCPKFSSPEVYAVIANAERETALADEAALELGRARLKHSAMNSAHEGYAVILEELDELWDEVKAQKPDRVKMRKEAIQVAAMALRFITDVCDKLDEGGGREKELEAEVNRLRNLGRFHWDNATSAAHDLHLQIAALEAEVGLFRDFERVRRLSHLDPGEKPEAGCATCDLFAALDQFRKEQEGK